MHDVGKIGIPDSILLKESHLTPTERLVMQQHTVIGADILGKSASPLLQTGAVIAISHHERWDGSGYPHGLAGEDIPLYGRLCAVADVFDALTSRRPYKEAYSIQKALRDDGGGLRNPFRPGHPLARSSKPRRRRDDLAAAPGLKLPPRLRHPKHGARRSPIRMGEGPVTRGCASGWRTGQPLPQPMPLLDS